MFTKGYNIINESNSNILNPGRGVRKFFWRRGAAAHPAPSLKSSSLYRSLCSSYEYTD